MALAVSRWWRCVCLAVGDVDGWISTGRLQQRRIHSNVPNSRRIVSYDSLPVKRRCEIAVEVK